MTLNEPITSMVVLQSISSKENPPTKQSMSSKISSAFHFPLSSLKVIPWTNLISIFFMFKAHHTFSLNPNLSNFKASFLLARSVDSSKRRKFAYKRGPKDNITGLEKIIRLSINVDSISLWSMQTTNSKRSKRTSPFP